MNTPAVEISRVEELLQTVSASRLITFHSCRLKFYFQYVLQLPRSKTGALHIGSTVHAVLQFWNKARWRNQPTDSRLLQSVYENQWVELQKESPIQWKADEESESKSTAWGLLELYLKETPIPANEKPEAVEVPVDVNLEDHGLPTLIGILDLVRAGGQIVDFKTASQTPSQEKAAHFHECQMSCYAILYRSATGKKESGLEIHHLVKLKSPKVIITPSGPMTEQQQVRLFKLMESYVTGVEREDWIPSPNLMTCSCCEYFNHCRKWS